MKIYLASGSPRRKELFGWLGLEFSVVDHGFDERQIKDSNPGRLVKRLALEKARAVKKTGLVIGSDLVVVLGQEIIGKPRNLAEARKILRKLRAKEHQVKCGLCLRQGKREKLELDTTRVWMKAYPDEIIEKYVKSFAVLDRGGSYGIQDELRGYGSLVDRFEGGITTIIGLPLLRLEKMLLEFGVKPKTNWREICLQETGYEY
jgi:septum formation protein